MHILGYISDSEFNPEITKVKNCKATSTLQLNIFRKPEPGVYGQLGLN
jgi:hypothetical protein